MNTNSCLSNVQNFNVHEKKQDVHHGANIVTDAVRTPKSGASMVRTLFAKHHGANTMFASDANAVRLKKAFAPLWGSTCFSDVQTTLGVVGHHYGMAATKNEHFFHSGRASNTMESILTRKQ